MGSLEYSESFKYKVMSSAKRANSTSSFFYLACFFPPPLVLSTWVTSSTVLSKRGERAPPSLFQSHMLVFLIEHHHANDKVALFALRSLGSLSRWDVELCQNSFSASIDVIAWFLSKHPITHLDLRISNLICDEINTAHVHFPQSSTLLNDCFQSTPPVTGFRWNLGWLLVLVFDVLFTEFFVSAFTCGFDLSFPF